jgi:ribosome-associated toxin RatA of RatAB toxin-antitoxin module
MKRNFACMSWLTLAAAILMYSPLALSDAGPEAQRLMKRGKAERYEVLTPHSRIKAGAARIYVRAPAGDVRKIVLDFNNYPKFISKFEQARIVGKAGKNTDVYLQVPILKGAAKIWAVVRFGPPKTIKGEEIIEAKMIKGNVERLDAKWRIKSLDEKSTQLHLEMLIVPKIPVPGSLITGEVAYAADVAVKGSRNRAEKRQ